MIHVGLDLDGVVRNLTEHAIACYKQDYPENAGAFRDTTSDWGFESALKVQNYDLLKHFKEYAFGKDRSSSIDVFRTAPPYRNQVKNWSRCYNILNRAGALVSVCTSQQSDLHAAASAEWINQHNVVCDNIIVTKCSKKGIYGLDYHLDDKPKHVASVTANGGYGVLMRRDWNKSARSRVDKSVSSVMEYTKFILEEENMM